MMEKYKILLDTDIGDDIDDALALALALEMPEMELVGVTTVFQNTEKRARIARKMLSLWGRDVPAYAGIALGEKAGMPYAQTPCQYTPELDSPEYAPCNVPAEDEGMGAVDFLIRSAEQFGPELTIVAIGPLTNIARAIQKAPQSMRRVQRIVLMGGSFQRQFREWNIVCDPLSAKRVMEFEGEVVCIGLDVTSQTRLSRRQHEMLLGAKGDEKRAYLSRLVELYTASTGNTPILHDPLTVYYVAHPEILLTEPTLVQVETEGTLTRGMTVNVDQLYEYLPHELEGARLLVAKAVRSREFIADFMRIVLQLS